MADTIYQVDDLIEESEDLEEETSGANDNNNRIVPILDEDLEEERTLKRSERVRNARHAAEDRAYMDKYFGSDIYD